MFTDETERRDWLFGLVVTVLVIGVLYFIRSQTSEQNLSKATPAEVIDNYSDDVAETPLVIREDLPAPEHDAVVPSIARVFECESNGQRILSDRPCGSGVSVRYVVAPNTMDAQDTRQLYRTPPRSVQVQKVRASQQHGGSNSSRCNSLEEQIDLINARMRRPYTSQDGERFRQRLRALSAERWDAKCGR